ncbi:ABC transporter ATP-binding protein [Alkalicella caledoniensis]|uniref:ABC transporter ATP-binding protein n=1 Tax=Alkalicella caledoniensis TaxID=2731377 RepID=A0A7G9W7K9_ALKCA|nr:ABC transporter ATP-binding protein [Alkalicella caledoniensis]QNO14671.1 ABC transporter ATP-binding protein [Alkalicella caledoniensis]
MNLYEVKALTKTYGENQGKVLALNNTSVNIEKGKFIVVLGPSGSGKSTLLNILGGMDIPTSGQVTFNQMDISKYNKKQLTKLRKEKIGFVFQSYNLLPSLTALENVEFSTEIAGLKREVAKEAMALVGLEERYNHFPSQLSGGEQQRISIARALAKKPEVLLCDEPTGALDSDTGVKILHVLKSINKGQGTSIIVITHSQDIAKIADVVIKMRNGEVVEVIENPTPISPDQVNW